MDIPEIYQKFDQIGCLTFATVNEDLPHELVPFENTDFLLFSSVKMEIHIRS